MDIDKQIVVVDLALEVFRDLRNIEWPLIVEHDQDGVVVCSIPTVRHRYNVACDALDILASVLRQERDKGPL